ncbi:hypothetical protein BpHYR1_028762 [Brachionus plicatilis]|uniref:Uncharacterized protein n=1 Tax=Brachionus plicatilis TaxID=10195 RepID=A0A3M7RS74_BRAPC|nr:hypothetical protein BpHYR1_028762 [Brachionus plicatilis]
MKNFDETKLKPQPDWNKRLNIIRIPFSIIKDSILGYRNELESFIALFSFKRIKYIKFNYLDGKLNINWNYTETRKTPQMTLNILVKSCEKIKPLRRK